MHTGLQSHFAGPIEQDKLVKMAERFEMFRADIQQLPIDIAREVIDQIESVSRMPYLTFDTHEQLEALPDGLADVEYQNEVNIGLGRPAPIPALTYRAGFEKAIEIAARKNIKRIWGGVIANFDADRDHLWLNQMNFKTLPLTVGATQVCCSAHHYTDGVHFEDVRPGFSTREAEIEWFRAAIGWNRIWGISECGYNGLSDGDYAHEMTKEWKFFDYENAFMLIQYQIRDAPPGLDDAFGIYTHDGQLKQAVFDAVPKRSKLPHQCRSEV